MLITGAAACMSLITKVAVVEVICPSIAVSALMVPLCWISIALSYFWLWMLGSVPSVV